MTPAGTIPARQPRSRRTVERLMRAAESLFAARGIAGVGVADIWRGPSVFGFLSVLVVGCSTEPTSTPHVARFSVQPGTPFTMDDHFADIAERIPGFAGYYFDRGDLVVRTTDLSTGQRLDAEVRAIGDGRLFRLPTAFATTPELVIRSAEFDFPTLQAWRGTLERVPGVSFSDVDEANNRVHIGVVDAASLAAVEKRRTDLEIPAAGVFTEIHPYGRVELSLRDLFAIVPGGVRVQSFIAGAYRSCTLGINVETDGYSGFVINSHCTAVIADEDGRVFHQPTPPDDIGVELFDPDPVTGAGCPGPWICRYSDAAFAVYGDDYSNHGTIARTKGFGSITIDPVHPVFTIEDVQLGHTSFGTYVHKVGQTTGWTAGVVTGTCVNHTFDPGLGHDPYTALCQGVALYDSDQGESGAPIFTWDGEGSAVVLHGIHIGAVGPYRYFSYWMLIEFELGAELGSLDPTFGGGGGLE